LIVERTGDHIRYLEDCTLSRVVVRAELDPAQSRSARTFQSSVEFRPDRSDLPRFGLFTVDEQGLPADEVIWTADHQLYDLILDPRVAGSRPNVGLRPQSFVEDTSVCLKGDAAKTGEKRLPNLRARPTEMKYVGRWQRSLLSNSQQRFLKNCPMLDCDVNDGRD
jgi:hypothetical protein